MYSNRYNDMEHSRVSFNNETTKGEVEPSWIVKKNNNNKYSIKSIIMKIWLSRYTSIY